MTLHGFLVFLTLSLAVYWAGKTTHELILQAVEGLVRLFRKGPPDAD